MSTTATVRRAARQERRFTVMGTRAHVLVIDGEPELTDLVRVRLAALEARWSRFRPGSDVSALNRASGTWIPVAPETITLLEAAVAGAQRTGGRFDPTVGAAVIAHGYDRTFAEVPAHAAHLQPHPVVDGSWPAIEVDAARGLACLPAGTTFDPGGIGKGLAADLVVAELGERAAGLLINLGGDLRMVGAAPDPAGWVVAIDDPHHPDRSLGRFAVPGGAVATSSKLQRRWTTAAGPAHHVVDPATGRPSASVAAAVTVLAGTAWVAEVTATALLLDGPEALEATTDVEAVMVLDDGTVLTTPRFDGALR